MLHNVVVAFASCGADVLQGVEIISKQFKSSPVYNVKTVRMDWQTFGKHLGSFGCDKCFMRLSVLLLKGCVAQTLHTNCSNQAKSTVLRLKP